MYDKETLLLILLNYYKAWAAELTGIGLTNFRS